MKRSSVIILGAGGHARVLLEVLKVNQMHPLGFIDVNTDLKGKKIDGIEVLGDENDLLNYKPQSIELVNGIGSTKSVQSRKEIYVKWKKKNYSFANVVHPGAWVSDTARLGEGVQIMAGAIVQPGVCLEENVVLNTAASVDHDCVVEAHAFLSPGCILNGGVRIGAETHVGSGAIVLQYLSTGKQCLLAAGSVVVKNVMDGEKVIGLPAKNIS